METRQLEFTQEIADYICDRLMGGESLRAICRDENMPTAVAVCKWVDKYPEFGKQYARAREVQADSFFDEIVDIANKPFIGVKKKTTMSEGKTTIEVSEGDMVDHRRLQIDARKWVAGKMRPKKYGDTGRDQASGTSNESVVRVEGALPGEFGNERGNDSGR